MGIEPTRSLFPDPSLVLKTRPGTSPRTTPERVSYRSMAGGCSTVENWIRWRPAARAASIAARTSAYDVSFDARMWTEGVAPFSGSALRASGNSGRERGLGQEG